MRRADFFFAFGDEDQIHRELLAHAPDGMKRRQEGGLRALLVDCSPADDHFSQFGLIDQGGLEGRGRPLGRIDLLYVVHEIKAQSARCTGIEGGENSGMAVGRHLGYAVESGIAQHAHGQVATFVHAAILGGNRRLANPLLDALHSLIVAFLDLFPDGLQVGILGWSKSRKGKRGRTGSRRIDEVSAVHGEQDIESQAGCPEARTHRKRRSGTPKPHRRVRRGGE